MSGPCRCCGRTFVREDHLDLHHLRDHAEVLTDAERSRAEAALAREAVEVARVRRHARGVLAVLPVAVTVILILVMMHLSGVPFALGLLLVPGAGAFGAVLYWLQLTREG